VSYTSMDGVSKEWLVTQWTASVEAQGWVEDTRTESGNGDTLVYYTLPSGGQGSLSVDTHTHQVWWVTVRVPTGGMP